ncbi:MAG: hypothetical protein HYW57_03930 [Ignavibacteriales bacterium]|nr:hypothetical protein [Ignavibacteriales bacterium]
MKIAMRRGTPDRVPVMCQMSIGHMLLQLGVSPLEFWHDPVTFSDGLVRLRSIYGFDGILVSLHGHDPDWRSTIASTGPSEEGNVVTFTDGHQMIYPTDNLPRPTTEIRTDSPSLQSFDPSLLPEVLDYIPVSLGLHFQIHSSHRFDVFRMVREKSGGDISVHGEVTSPFDYFLDLFGYEGGLVGLLREPEKSLTVLSRFTGLVSTLVEEMCATSVDAIKISSPFAGSAFISRDFYQRFVLPHESAVAAAAHRHGVPIYTHTCGSVGDRLDLMFDAGVDGIECLDPPPLGDVDLEEAKERTEGRGFIKGNVDSVHTLLLKGENEILADLEKKVKVGKKGGGYILSTACSVAPGVERSKLLLMREAAERWG